MKKVNVPTVNKIIDKFEELNRTTFVGVKEYTSKTTGETANHVINAHFSYENAIKKDLTALINATPNDVLTIANNGNFSPMLVREAIDKLTNQFRNNLNPVTASNGSKGQKEAYRQITSSIKLHIESGKFHIYGLTVQKKVLKAGVYKQVKSNDLTLCQNAIKKYFNFLIIFLSV